MHVVVTQVARRLHRVHAQHLALTRFTGLAVASGELCLTAGLRFYGRFHTLVHSAMHVDESLLASVMHGSEHLYLSLRLTSYSITEVLIRDVAIHLIRSHALLTRMHSRRQRLLANKIFPSNLTQRL